MHAAEMKFSNLKENVNKAAVQTARLAPFKIPNDLINFQVVTYLKVDNLIYCSSQSLNGWDKKKLEHTSLFSFSFQDLCSQKGQEGCWCDPKKYRRVGKHCVLTEECEVSSLFSVLLFVITLQATGLKLFPCNQVTPKI